MDNLQAFEEHVAMKYHVFNGMFLTLPFEGVTDAGIMLPIFSAFVREHLERGRTPAEAVDRFFREKMSGVAEDDRIDVLFRFMQLVERQVVLFDALEDAAYSRIRDVDGPGSLRELLGRVENEQRHHELVSLLRHYRVRLVLTAHPTQFYPDEILGILTDLGTALDANDIRRVHDLLLQMGMTRFKNREKPTPFDEAKSLLWFMENVFYPTVPDIHRRVLVAAGLSDTETLDFDSPLELGFWPGGDRDGNPFVTSDLTVRIGHMLRTSILSLYLKDMSRLLRRLTFDGVVETVEAIHERLNFTAHPYTVHPGADVDDASGCEDRADLGYDSAAAFLDDLRRLRMQIQERHGGLYVNLLDDLIYRVRIFGFHFATMDIRQDSRVHEKLVATLVQLLARYRNDQGAPPAVLESAGGHRSYTDLNVDERLALIEELSDLFPLDREIMDDLEDGISRDTVQSLRAARSIQYLNGERGVHRYIISNTRNAANVMEVWLLAHAAGSEEAAFALDIVPLFETVDDLERARDVMDRLYSMPLYRRHLAARGNIQTIMLGFSDGTKDGGYMTANWKIFRAKQTLTEVSRRHGYQVVFFDGRGGPPARGGGNTHKFYRSLGKNIESREIHLTIQGQTISSKYGNAPAATHNMEQLVSAGVDAALFPEDMYELDSGDIAILEELSAQCNAEYLKLKARPDFVPYLLECSPLRYYGMTNIGSRPTSRTASSDFQLSDLRAIPFVGAWSQLKQNVPGFYGLGTGLARFRQEGRDAEVRELYQRSLFFRTLVENAMQALQKTQFSLTYYLQRDSRFGEIWKMVFDEAQQTIHEVKSLSGQSVLLENDPVVRRSIELREQMVFPSLVIQRYALDQLRSRDEGESTYTDDDAVSFEKLIVKSLAASVNASRNAV
ncbi:MAG: phosphoenolpyruvate carboxylase [Spirochaetaceae bacterium]|nr:MAG: phosphoenolpyruvate carboxylase [Spirochaetaceae bacterium]